MVFWQVEVVVLEVGEYVGVGGGGGELQNAVSAEEAG